MADRPLGTQAIVFHHHRCLPDRDRATGAAWNGATFFLFRFLTGCGIGGEYAAINSTIQELIPARFRGHIDLMINGPFWVGAALGALVAVGLLNPAWINPELGWRLAFLTGAVIGAVVFLTRMWIPESPRWLAIHGREAEGEAVVAGIEQRFIDAGQHLESVPESAAIRLRSRTHTPIGEALNALFVTNRVRTVVGLVLMAAQAFFYNAIFFTYALVLTRFFSVPSGDVGWYILPFAAGNFLGPVVLGRLFDTIGRRQMISATYAISGLLLAGCGVLFDRDLLTAETQTLAWMVVFFFASAAASAAYLTVSENFPIEIRALTIAIFYAIGTALGGVAAPFVFGKLIESGSRQSIFGGYVFAAILMLVAAIVAARYAVAAERKPLEQVATPLSAAGEARRLHPIEHRLLARRRLPPPHESEAAEAKEAQPEHRPGRRFGDGREPTGRALPEGAPQRGPATWRRSLHSVSRLRRRPTCRRPPSCKRSRRA